VDDVTITADEREHVQVAGGEWLSLSRKDGRQLINALTAEELIPPMFV
jgi:hypothetical protein